MNERKSVLFDALLMIRSLETALVRNNIGGIDVSATKLRLLRAMHDIDSGTEPAQPQMHVSTAHNLFLATLTDIALMSPANDAEAVADFYKARELARDVITK